MESMLRCVSLIFHSQQFRGNLYTIVERITSDMGDYAWTPKVEVSSKHVEVNIYDIDEIEGWREEPLNFLEKTGAEVPCAHTRIPDKGHYVLSREFDDTKLTMILPFREGPYYVIEYQDGGQMWNQIKDDDEAKKEIREVSLKSLGFDLVEMKDHIGSMMMVWHHDVVKNIDFTATNNPPGLLCSIIKRQIIDYPLSIEVKDFTKDQKEEIGREKFDIKGWTRKKLLRMKRPVTRPSVEVYDQERNLIFSMKGMVFIRKIVIGMSFEDGVTGFKRTHGNDVIEIDNQSELDEETGKKSEAVNKIYEVLKEFDPDEAHQIIEEVVATMPL